ncbi:DUF1741-domain-containing protein [Lentinus tigrinus ALCF2SS1-6]|uniref:DUF1741-domain-containing protein n=1 Tax=Lentinus tigrinus ALCF2SS1-6 TaxID=1328759 RepID=A0A5C2RY60_9APHY|nr:DUF1741-domain-containing protein [Lentinus tigrinus ALCF2SS1-6]
MEVFAGGVGDSDTVFQDLTAAIDETLSNTSTSASLRHEALQLAVIFVCGISQLSPGAYFLRHDLFSCIVTTVTSPDTEQFTFEAILLLALLANFHKSDAAKLNPYLKRIRETQDEDFMRMTCWAANFAASAVAKAYQSIQDDSPPTLTTSLGSFLSSLRPDRAFASQPIDPPRELFKNQPIEACVILLPLFEFLYGSALFRRIFAGTLVAAEEEKKTATRITPLPLTLLSLSSYLFSHASSSSSPRAIAYAHLAMSTLLVMAESDEIMAALRTESKEDIRLCRQRQPPLPQVPPPSPSICALLDCCIIWLRHNLHKKLEVACYLTCIRTCHRTVWYLQREHVRLVYHWQELWRALILLLEFLASKLDSLVTTGGIKQLAEETILLVDLALCRNEQLLPSPTAVHELVYEVVRSADVFRKQQGLLEKLANPHPDATEKRLSGFTKSRAPQALANVTAVAEHYETKLRETGIRSANQGLRAVAKEIEKDGLNYGQDLHGTDDPPKQSEDVAGFIRFAYADGMALMP